MSVKISDVEIPVRIGVVEAQLSVVTPSEAVVIFAHGSGSGRFSRRNQVVAGELNANGFSTLLLDLLTQAEEEADLHTLAYRFNIPLLGSRLVSAIDWVQSRHELIDKDIMLFGASTGAAAAIIAAAKRPEGIGAIVCRGGRPDLAERRLDAVRAPTLLIAGEYDRDVIHFNRQAMDKMTCERRLAIIPNASHLFEEPGALEEVAKLASAWFAAHVRTPQPA